MTGDEARAIRLGMGLSARALGVLIGADESSIYRWEWRHDQEVPRIYGLALRSVLRDFRRAQGGCRSEN